MEEECKKPDSPKILGSYALILCVIMSLASGALSGWYFSRGKDKEVVVLDLSKIIEDKRKEFVEKYRNREGSSRLREEMEREISLFTEALNRVIEEESRGKVILAKESVISDARDITESVNHRIAERLRSGP